MPANLLFLAVLVLLPLSAHAYIGPGMGAGVIASILGLISAIFLALAAIVYYPIKRALKKRKKNKSEAESGPEVSDQSDPKKM